MQNLVSCLAAAAHPWRVTLFVWMLLAACTDSPTAPTGGGIGAVDRRPNKDYVLEPIIVIGTPRCNPYLSANFCQGPGTGTCITSSPGEATDPELVTVSSCPGGDAGGGGSSAGGGAGGDPGGDASKQSHNDTGLCPPCQEREPTDAEEQTMQSLLPQVQCTDARTTLTTMLGNGTLLVYEQDNGLYGGWNSDHQRIYISRPKHWLSTGVDMAELIDTMVHEAVHKLLGHTNGQDPSQTHAAEFRNKMASCGFPQP